MRRKVVIVGSGFGAAMTALRLVQQGIPCTILEKGRRWDGPVPAGETRFSAYLPPDGRSTWLRRSTRVPLGPALPVERFPGVLEGRDLGPFRVMSAAAYGGGSIVYGGVQAIPDPALFRRVFPSWLPFESLSRHFARVSELLPASPVPEDVMAGEDYLHARIARRHAREAGFEVDAMRTATDWSIVRAEQRGELPRSVLQGEAIYGVNSGAKTTLDMGPLATAERTGLLEVRALTEVLDLDTSGREHSLRLLLRDERGRPAGIDRMRCRSLFLCAGSVGSTRLLVDARARGGAPSLSSRVGDGFGTNGNVYALRIVDEAAGRWQAGPPAVAIRRPDAETPLFIEHPQLPLGVDLRALLYFGIGLTSTRGRFYVDAQTRRVGLWWPPGPDLGQARVNRALLDTLSRMNAVSGGRGDSLIHRLLFGGDILKDDAVYHPLGGCVLGEATDEFGRVRGARRLYVNDGALLPGSSAGVNPSMTIAALADRNAERIIAEDF